MSDSQLTYDKPGVCPRSQDLELESDMKMKAIVRISLSTQF